MSEDEFMVMIRASVFGAACGSAITFPINFRFFSSVFHLKKKEEVNKEKRRRIEGEYLV